MTSTETYRPAWSVSRKARLEFCPRSAVMHYREAPEAMKDTASPRQKAINMIHRNISDERFLREILLRTMQSHFTGGNKDAGILQAEVLRNFEREFSKMIMGNSPYFLYSLQDRNASPESKRRELSLKLQNYSQALSAGAWQSLLKIPVQYRKRISGILKINVNELVCLTTVLCAFTNNGRLWIVELRNGDFSAYERELCMIHRSYAMDINWMPDKVDSFVLDYATGQMYKFDWDNDISAAIQKISDDISRWHDIYQLPLEKIPENKSNCPHCGFADICRQLT